MCKHEILELHFYDLKLATYYRDKENFGDEESYNDIAVVAAHCNNCDKTLTPQEIADLTGYCMFDFPDWEILELARPKDWSFLDPRIGRKMVKQMNERTKILTDNLADFSSYNLGKASVLLSIFADWDYARSLPELDDAEEITLCLDKSSDCLFLKTEIGLLYASNEEYDGNPIDIWLTCSKCGREGFPDELKENLKCQSCKDLVSLFAGVDRTLD